MYAARFGEIVDFTKGIADKIYEDQEALSDSARNMMASVKVLTGKQGPDLMFHAPVRTQTGLVNQDIAIQTGNLDAAYTILLFYQGECPLCEDALIDLANKYKRLSEKNVRVIAISADKTTFAGNFLPAEVGCLNFINADLPCRGIAFFNP